MKFLDLKLLHAIKVFDIYDTLLTRDISSNVPVAIVFGHQQKGFLNEEKCLKGVKGY